tara:strand:+ start:21 stop:797 length:777 start_codon:yes stop_codon:yes gene_type:complete
MNVFLTEKNKHERDNHITFDEVPHIYTIDGDSAYTSVTTFIHSLFEKFDADEIITRMMRSKKWTESKYYGMSRDEIKGAWNKNRDVAANAGTKLHYDIECFYNENESNNDSVEYKYFMKFVDDTVGHLIPYRTEWMIYDKELKLAGSIDMIFQDVNGELHIYDWKRCKEIMKYSKFNKFSNNDIVSHLPDTNFWHYCLQLNTYKALIERNYGKKITNMYLVCLHPDNKRESYELIRVVDLQHEVAELFKQRREQLGIL